MAILKQRIKKKNSSGTYDTLHIETNSNLVLMDNGNSLQYEMYNHTHTTGQISNFPSSMPPTGHTHSTSDIWNFPSSMTPTYHTHSTGDIWNFPSTMAPSWHQHNASDILNLPAGLQMKTGSYTGNNVDGRYINIGVTAKFGFIFMSDRRSGAILVQNDGNSLAASGIANGSAYGILSGTYIILYNAKSTYGYPVNETQTSYKYFVFY